MLVADDVCGRLGAGDGCLVYSWGAGVERLKKGVSHFCDHSCC